MGQNKKVTRVRNHSNSGNTSNRAKISDETKEHIRKASEHDAASIKNRVVAAPGAIVGAVQLATENPMGVVGVVSAVPNLVKAEYHTVKAGEERVKTAISVAKDMKGKNLAEKAAISGSLVNKTAKTYSQKCKDEVNNLTPDQKEGIKRNVTDTIGSFCDKSNNISSKPAQQKISVKNKNMSI